LLAGIFPALLLCPHTLQAGGNLAPDEEESLTDSAIRIIGEVLQEGGWDITISGEEDPA
jgi:hypothetical protein